MPRKPDPKSKAGFVRSFPSSTPGAEVVAKAKAKGIKIDLAYVYSVRTAVRAKRKKARASATAPVAKRGPGRPPKAAAAASSDGGSSGTEGRRAGGFIGEIERFAMEKVAEALKAKLGKLFG